MEVAVEVGVEIEVEIGDEMMNEGKSLPVLLRFTKMTEVNKT